MSHKNYDENEESRERNCGTRETVGGFQDVSAEALV